MDKTRKSEALVPTRPTGLRAPSRDGLDTDTDETIEMLRERRSGAPADDSGRRCGRCGEHVPPRYRFCGSCGFNLTGHPGGIAERDPLIGVVIGDRYRLLSRLGVGGMGTVYKAEHVRMGKLVAVKLLHGDLSRDETMIRRFNREARAASKLSSPNSVVVFDYGQSDGLVYLVMEYLRGRDLGQILRARGKLSPTDAVRITGEVAESLAEAHRHGIVHRDLKPENIFLCAPDGDDDPGLVKVLDFGLAKLRESERTESLVDSGGSIIGTPHYMSPEQISGLRVDVRSDVYSLAAVTFKLLTGAPPYMHDNPVAVLSKHLTASIPSMTELDDALEPLDPVIRRALAKRPDDRYETVLVFANELRRAALGEGANAAAAAFPEVRRAARDSREVTTRKEFDRYETWLRLKRAFAVMLLFGFLGAGGYLFWWGVVEKNFIRSDTESEPNDDLQHANAVFADEPIAGYIGVPAVGERADVDFYQIENPGRGDIVASIDVTGVEGMDLVVKAYDEMGHELVAVNRGREGEGERIPNLRLRGQVLYVQVREFWVQYRQATHNLESPYQLTISFRPPYDNEEQEPNQRIPSALQVVDGETYVGYVGWPGDIDVYRAPALPLFGSMLEISVAGGGNLDLSLDLFDATGAELGRFDHSPAGEGEAVDLFVSQNGHGALLVAVEAANGEDSDPERQYQIRMRTAPVEPLSPPADLLGAPE